MWCLGQVVAALPATGAPPGPLAVDDPGTTTTPSRTVGRAAVVRVRRARADRSQPPSRRARLRMGHGGVHRMAGASRRFCSLRRARSDVPRRRPCGARRAPAAQLPARVEGARRGRRNCEGAGLRADDRRVRPRLVRSRHHRRTVAHAMRGARRRQGGSRGSARARQRRAAPLSRCLRAAGGMAARGFLRSRPVRAHVLADDDLAPPARGRRATCSRPRARRPGRYRLPAKPGSLRIDARSRTVEPVERGPTRC